MLDFVYLAYIDLCILQVIVQLLDAAFALDLLATLLYQHVREVDLLVLLKKLLLVKVLVAQLNI